MIEIVDILKQLGPAGVIAIIAWKAFSYLLKSAEKKNNIIANHINHNSEVLEKLRESIEKLIHKL